MLFIPYQAINKMFEWKRFLEYSYKKAQKIDSNYNFIFERGSEFVKAKFAYHDNKIYKMFIRKKPA